MKKPYMIKWSSASGFTVWLYGAIFGKHSEHCISDFETEHEKEDRN